MIRSLNTKQRIAFETILKWCRQNIHSQPSTPPCNNSKPPQLSITGGAEAGKSHLIKTIYQTSSKIFKEGHESPEKPSVLLLAPTGVSAISVSGTTIHTGLSIPINFTGYSVPPLSDLKNTILCNQLSELRMVIIDEVSMVSNEMLLYVHQRLKEIFDTPDNVFFGGKCAVDVGDFFSFHL